MAEPLPELLRDVRGIGLHERHERLGGESHIAGMARIVLHLVEVVHELEEGGDRRVKLEAPADVVRDLRNRRVRLAHHRAVRRSLGATPLRHLERQSPDPVEQPRGALDPGVVPLHVLLGGAHVEDVEPHGVGPVALEHRLGGDDVPPRLGHLRAEVVDHPLVEEAQERLPEAEQAEVVHDLREEARVHEVEDRVLDSADVLVDGEPVVGESAIESRLVVVRVAIADEVPGGIDERVHGVRLPTGLAAAGGASRPHPIFRRREG
jgi:hypothetical protein